MMLDFRDEILYRIMMKMLTLIVEVYFMTGSSVHINFKVVVNGCSLNALKEVMVTLLH